MSNKQAMIRQCTRENNVRRRVYPGRLDRNTFFQNVQGSLLMSGMGACREDRLIDMMRELASRKDMSTIFLSSRPEMIRALSRAQEEGILQGVMVSYYGNRNYHPMYGFSSQQVCELIRLTAERIGCTVLLDQLLLYANAIMNIVSIHYPLSLSAISQILKYDDDYIAQVAQQSGLTNIIVGDILGNHQAGIMFRRVIEKLEEIFSEVSVTDTETKYNLVSGAKGNVPVMAFYTVSREQKIMNVYLKEEIYSVLQRVSRVRIIVDEMTFESGDDELLRYLFDLKRRGQIQLIVCSENAKEMLQCDTLDFANSCLFAHATKTGFDDISGALYGMYTYSYPVEVLGKPPTIFFTLKHDNKWEMKNEERLRVRMEDLYERSMWSGTMRELVAVQLNGIPEVYLVQTENL